MMAPKRLAHLVMSSVWPVKPQVTSVLPVTHLVSWMERMHVFVETDTSRKPQSLKIAVNWPVTSSVWLATPLRRPARVVTQVWWELTPQPPTHVHAMLSFTTLVSPCVNRVIFLVSYAPQEVLQLTALTATQPSIECLTEVEGASAWTSFTTQESNCAAVAMSSVWLARRPVQTVWLVTPVGNWTQHQRCATVLTVTVRTVLLRKVVDNLPAMFHVRRAKTQNPFAHHARQPITELSIQVWVSACVMRSFTIQGSLHVRAAITHAKNAVL